MIPKRFKKFFRRGYFLSLVIHLVGLTLLPLINFQIERKKVSAVDLIITQTFPEANIEDDDTVFEEVQKITKETESNETERELEMPIAPKKLDEPIIANKHEEDKLLATDALISENNSLELLHRYLKTIPLKKNFGTAPFKLLNEDIYRNSNRVSKNVKDLLNSWKQLRENGKIKNNPLQLPNAPNRSGMPLGNWWGYYVGLEKPPSDTLWGLSKINLDSLIRAKELKNTENQKE